MKIVGAFFVTYSVIVVSEKFHSIEKSYINSQLKPFLVAEGTGVIAH